MNALAVFDGRLHEGIEIPANGVRMLGMRWPRSHIRKRQRYS